MQRGYARYVVVYDISLDRERSKVDAVLSNYGFRAQKSVFEVELNKSGLAEITGKLEALAIMSGSILVWRVQSNFSRLNLGFMVESPSDSTVFIV
jgi:CRISPR-associated endonuclease Cas2